MASVNQAVSKSVPGRRKAGLMADLIDLARTLAQGLDPYRPELHYMRGPGPKWHAKHARPAVVSEPDLGGMVKVSA